MKNYNREETYIKAKKRVDEIKGFIIHLLVYIIINATISTVKVIHNINRGETFDEAFFDFSTFAVWMAWGIGIVFHGFAVLTETTVSFKRWKEKKLQSYIEEEAENFQRTNSQLRIEGYNGDFTEREAYFRAKKKLDELMGFYWHAVVYIVVNVFILLVLFFVSDISFTAWYTYATAIFWGVGLGIHAACIFGKNVIFGQKWEQQKVEEYMRKDQQSNRWN